MAFDDDITFARPLTGNDIHTGTHRRQALQIFKTLLDITQIQDIATVSRECRIQCRVGTAVWGQANIMDKTGQNNQVERAGR
ncbi:hypothetical protein KB20921_29340 [Edwardsiella ictaluri]|nr:hypothetical protein KH20906_29230 [Edwardsiella ictaluri]BEI03673.1 hypothetical protein KB20921_29340 [Edwardsiella ictaluri]BEI07130.1 hypothetical protein KH201010_29160 [Edwardsiella ictaluri]BEI10601.1 hypothetical protein STU22726_29320 [Edwardsiella ictaluri]BEI14079.1 hypothetical protein STU22816_29320 [Edwardsiella ictaluri]